ncbi:hypothetical protein PBRA_009479 [Plasmodiophora brassicae]|uniref:Uncharacterized protein n=1 Tax=Plasmodiophora brassicae TaxID=37360 RepID=A0A0G4J897_PLABS|nr:hypothetical protein PBRA_009479 [Plasmodiophora brassicae]
MEVVKFAGGGPLFGRDYRVRFRALDSLLVHEVWLPNATIICSHPPYLLACYTSYDAIDDAVCTDSIGGLIPYAIVIGSHPELREAAASGGDARLDSSVGTSFDIDPFPQLSVHGLLNIPDRVLQHISDLFSTAVSFQLLPSSNDISLLLVGHGSDDDVCRARQSTQYPGVIAGAAVVHHIFTFRTAMRGREIASALLQPPAHEGPGRVHTDDNLFPGIRCDGLEGVHVSVGPWIRSSVDNNRVLGLIPTPCLLPAYRGTLRHRLRRLLFRLTASAAAQHRFTGRAISHTCPAGTLRLGTVASVTDDVARVFDTRDSRRYNRFGLTTVEVDPAIAANVTNVVVGPVCGNNTPFRYSSFGTIDDLVEDKVYLIYPESLDVGVIRAKFIGYRFNVPVGERRRNGTFRAYQTYRKLAVLIMSIPNAAVDGGCGTPARRRPIPDLLYKCWKRC